MRPYDAAATMNDDSLRAEATARDADDALREFRGEFHMPLDAHGEPRAYFCGHSLGLQPQAAASLVDAELDAWRQLGVEGHFNGRRPWVSYHELLADGLAHLAGALPSEVVAMNSLSVNLHLMLASFYRPNGTRRKIVVEQSAFPSDRYAVCSQLRWHGCDPASDLIEIAPREGEHLLREDDVCALLAVHGPSIATVLLPGVNYLTGQCFNLRTIAAAAHRHGATIGFDLAHAIGNVPLQLHDSGADFAVWCSYKYLNGGPGAIGGAFVHERHARAFDLPRLAGWWGHDKQSRFKMPQEFVPLAGAEGWQVSNPPVLAMAPLLASLELFERATFSKLRAKSLALTEFLTRGLHSRLAEKIAIITPTDADARGCQLSLILNVEVARAERVRRQLLDAGVLCDWREPNVLRAAPVPFYNTYNDAWRLIVTLEEILA